MLFIYNISPSVQIATEIRYTGGKKEFSKEGKMEHRVIEIKWKLEKEDEMVGG